MSRVAFIGLGAMGSRMARRLLAAGHELVVWNRTGERAAELLEQGAAAASSPRAAADGADAVLTMVADAQALEDVTRGESGVLAGVGQKATVIQMSTVGVEPVRALAQSLPQGVGLLDGPVLGSIDEADAGKLQVFVGGDGALLERWRGLLSVLGSPVHVGEIGAGSAAKLVANSTLFGTDALIGEALLLADGLGLSRAAAFEVLARTPLASRVERRRGLIESGEYPMRFSLSLALKDARLVADAAGAIGADLKVAAAARSWLEDAYGAGYGDRDYATLIERILASRS